METNKAFDMMRDYADYSLLRHNTFGIDVRCRRFLEYTTFAEAQQVAAILRQSAARPYLIIGGGSNLLLTHDYDGTVVHAGVKGIELTEGATASTVTAGSGEPWDRVVELTVAAGYGDLVNLSHIPGEVGASVVQNIGAYGAEVAQFVDRIRAVEIATGQMVEIAAADCRYGYRDSRFKHEWKNRYLVYEVDYKLSRQATLNTAYGNIRSELERRGIAQPSARQLRQVIIDIRSQKLPDPAQEGNAGSFFMNPVVPRVQFDQLQAQYPQMPHYYVDEAHEKIPAGWMIEQCGWKGRTVGRAGVHDRQALVLVNRGGATGSEIVALCEAIRSDVRQKFGIDIQPEVNII
ncbi:MAG: UDP-N-acetylmuramate dehydrogenase [Prevotella sp.]|nr:UDP-N-acetylmuramate dehydrogenase [Prevotella sp.]